MNCLWIARELPFPPDAGDRIYSGHLATALAEAGAAVRFCGFAGAGAELPMVMDAAATASAPTSASASSSSSTSAAPGALRWLAVGGVRRSQREALFSPLPMAAAIHDTPAYRDALDAQWQDVAWDAIVFDSYGSGWALKRYLATRRRGRHPPPVLVYVAHNQEGALWLDLARRSHALPLQRIALWQNWLKVRTLERFILRHVDLTTAISGEDAAALDELAALAPDRSPLVLTPGYSGGSAPARLIDADCPRRVVLIGSFRWVVKQENLRRFVLLADAAFHRHGIAFDVIGDVPESLLAELQPRLKATVFHGFVDDVAPYFARARLAVVPEAIGGGFKLKFLDYIFGRVPVATLSAAAAGLPPGIRRHLLCRRDMAALVDAIVAHMDRLPVLNDMQQGALSAAGQLYRWRDRGSALYEAIATCREQRAGLATPRTAADYGVELS